MFQLAELGDDVDEETALYVLVGGSLIATAVLSCHRIRPLHQEHREQVRRSFRRWARVEMSCCKHVSARVGLSWKATGEMSSTFYLLAAPVGRVRPGVRPTPATRDR